GSRCRARQRPARGESHRAPGDRSPWGRGRRTRGDRCATASPGQVGGNPAKIWGSPRRSMKTNPAPKRRAPAPPKRVAAATADLPQPGHPRRLELLFAAGIVLVGFAIYWRSLWGTFLFDDGDLFEVTSSVRLKDWYVILTGPRPLLIFSYALNHWWAGGFDAFQFHVVSVVLHILNALVLWRILRGCLGRDPKGAIVAAFVPFLFLTSPIQTESVAYISSRSEVLAATFYLLGLWGFLSPWREERPWAASGLIVGLYGCAILSKQTAITLPAALLIADYFLLAKTDSGQVEKNWRIYCVLGFVMVAGGFFVIRNIIRVPSAGFFLKDVTWKTYLFTQFRMYFLYLRLLLVPFGLNADYDIAASRSLFDHG